MAKNISHMQVLSMVEVGEMVEALASLPSDQLRRVLDDIVVESEMNDGDVEDLAERFAEMVGKVVVSEDEESCNCEDCDGSCDDDDEEDEELELDNTEELKFPCCITCSDDDSEPIDIELSLEVLNVILDRSNQDECSFNDAFCAILQESLELLKEDLNDDEENKPDSTSDAFDF